MGYTYVMADLHGMYEKYMQMLHKIKFSRDDTLYILGDAIDRGRDGIRLLLDFMQRDNVKFLLGNHEDMMLKVVAAQETYGDEYERRRAHWFRNGGEVTAHYFFQCLNYKEQGKMIAYLEGCPLFLPEVKVGDNCYYLVHACPDLDGFADALPEDETTPDGLLMLGEDKAEQLKKTLLWTRLSGDEKVHQDATIIFGHTPTAHYQDNLPMTIWHGPGMINVDCGCAYLANGQSQGQLGCLRLEDGTEYYV